MNLETKITIYKFTPQVFTLTRVFHSIRFKVNKGWSTAVLLFLCPYVRFIHPQRPRMSGFNR